MPDFKTLARKTAKQHGLPASLFMSMVEHESSWTPDAVSSAGAIGLGQLMPATAKSLGVDPWNPQQNLDGAARHLKTMFRKTGNWRDALRAYNQGLAGSQRGPDYGAEYASSILAGRARYGKSKSTVPESPRQRFMAGMPKGAKIAGGGNLHDVAQILFGDDPDFLQAAQAVATRYSGPTNPRTVDELIEEGHAGHNHSTTPSARRGKPLSWTGSTMILPQVWKPSHQTDGLGWGTFSAIDIMGDPGTGVAAPEDATVIYWQPTGAQGGGSMLLRTASGREYWIGHIDDGVPAGTRVRRGDRIAVISADHDAPHVHLDRRG